jgi:hypothetical protein
MEAIASVYLDPDERVVRHIKVEAPTFDGRLNPWVFTKWFFFFFFLIGFKKFFFPFFFFFFSSIGKKSKP